MLNANMLRSFISSNKTFFDLCVSFIWTETCHSRKQGNKWASFRKNVIRSDALIMLDFKSITICRVKWLILFFQAEKELLHQKVNINNRTRYLLQAIAASNSMFNLSQYVDELKDHMLRFPDTRITAVKVCWHVWHERYRYPMS